LRQLVAVRYPRKEVRASDRCPLLSFWWNRI